MYSYPPEYLLHPTPVLALYGLTITNEAKLVDVDTQDTEPTTRSNLVNLLLNIFTSKTDYTLYEAPKYLSNNQTLPPFRVITVSKDYTLPQRAPPAAPNLPPPHSNLSPLSQDSPLYPDGVMTPLWIKKHLYLPSVVVGFYDIWESEEKAQREVGPLSSQVLIDPAERENDTNLAAEINSRRKYFQDKGIKFAAAIILKRRSSDAAIDERLSSIRKQCGLDTRSSFFTIAPGSSSEVQEFVNSLYRTLYEPALYFYSNRLKKIRKKKSKLPSPLTMPKPIIDLSSTEPQPLSIIGWILRYDFKIAFFQEMKQEIDGALKSYEAAYNTICELFAPNSSQNVEHAILVPNGKRWKEARSLADCINIKICKFNLYLNDPLAAVAQLNRHLHMFQSYSPNWGMGEHTFEYWAWLSKQYRIFGDIVDAAVYAGYKIPIPTSFSSGNLSLSNGNSGGCNPGAILQHPGFYYHLAAMCCAERRRQFLEMDRSDTAANNSLLQNERLVDHSSLTIELLTKSYEQFKRYRNGRMTLYLAAEIAGTYYETGKFDMAIKFFERIGKTYRKEKWNMVLTSILRWSLRCAKELGSWEKAVESLVELMSDNLPIAENKRHDIQKELMDILNNQSNDMPLIIHMDQINAFVTCQVQIKQQTNFVSAPVEYQITLKTNKASPLMPFRFNAARIIFSDPQYNLILQDSSLDKDQPKSIELIEFSNSLSKITEPGDYENWFTAEADLRVFKDQIKVLHGCVIPQDCGELKILNVYLDIITSNWKVELKYDLDKIAEDHPITRRKWLEHAPDEKLVFKTLDGHGHLSYANIMQKPPSIDLTFEHAAPAILDELFKVDMTMTNLETESIEAILCVEIKNSESTVNDDIMFTTEEHDTEEKEISLGIINPGESIIKPIYIRGRLVIGSRLVNVTIKYTIVGKTTKYVEKSESLRIPFIAPFDVNFELCAQTERLKESMAPILERSERWLLVASIRCFSTWDLDIQYLTLEENKIFSHPYTSLSLISKIDNFEDQTWKPGHVYNANYLFQLSTTDITEEQASVPAGTIVIKWKRSGIKEHQYNTSIIQLPSIQFQQQDLVILADIPSKIYLSEPFTLTYTVYNPTKYLADYTSSVELSEAFVFSGYKQFKGRVLPFSKATYRYICYPLLAGKVKLPRLKVMASQQQGGEKDVPIQIIGSGISTTLDNSLQTKNIHNPLDQPLFAFVNAKRNL
ncbi:Gryzun, putative trafficking through golgi-domain-containing protein [Cokeromyces recurvatus]|uniref:Gryzun, putative trafficking through golgi-domain-containing protein n=1 Tax=Cokeromyces recurvatus TaxID=90255 RepID=UPI00221FF2AB|nr:Gryzun, putative trafficking through golgi-domain-containing protein [Cokeromyces recurvatus]KAI7905331.1 Gryzun, putative trafficking through golgi-domain-containing protein [Cokeromyces recurvatus]